MNEEARHRRLAKLFSQVVDLTPPERSRVLQERCGGEPTLRQELENLLQYDDPGFLETTMAERPTRIAGFEIRRRLGEGGMGTVYLARQEQPVARNVALKVIRTRNTSEEAALRFASELQLLGSLNHDGIARVFDAGQTEDRTPYFVMEHVEGLWITNFCREHELTIRERLELFLQVCEAVQHAHRHGIVHRDIKPSNILVTGTRAQPVAKIIDFGIAKAVETSGELDPGMPDLAEGAGTPEYMGPEQTGPSDLVDTRTDVYALGATLYELVTGTVPVRLDSSSRGLVSEWAAAITNVPPQSPSERVVGDLAHGTAFAKTCGLSSAHQLRRILEGELDHILLRALEKQPVDRFPGVGELARNIEQYLQGRPVPVMPQTRRYLARKFVQRHRVGVALSSAIALLLLGSSVAITVFAVAADKRLDEFNTFGLVRGLRSLEHDEESRPVLARKETVGQLEAWEDEVVGILAQFDRLRRLRDEIVSEAKPPDSVTDWTDGRKARLELLDSIEETFRRAARMSGPTGVLTWARRRIDWAKQVHERTVEDHAAAWERAIREVAADSRFRSRRFGGSARLRPQTGLVPIGPDPDTGLQEFAFLLPEGEIPGRINGKLEIGPRSCPVFVLLPGGSTVVGAQDDDEDLPHYDPYREQLEAASDPVRTVEIEPFFASKYEFTHGQWLLTTGYNGAESLEYQEVAPVDLTHPAMAFDGGRLDYVLDGWGLRLPSDVEWEYLARAGSTDVWCWGKEPICLYEKANIADQDLVEVGDADDEFVVDWRDGWVRTSPVGWYGVPNGFGLFDVHGNVAELCDSMRSDGSRALDARGGSWHQGWKFSRIGNRTNWDGWAVESIGFRPAISIRDHD